MSILDPLDGACPAQHPSIPGQLGRCVRGRGHKGWHSGEGGSYFELPNECVKCARSKTDVLSIGGDLIARRCPLCGEVSKP